MDHQNNRQRNSPKSPQPTAKAANSTTRSPDRPEPVCAAAPGYAALKRLLIFPIKVYQITLSPLIGRQCRHWPTCSHYAIEAIERHGPFYGLWLAVWRIVRCNPFFRGGVDPVPPVRAKK